jgi:hypothetical protein
MELEKALQPHDIELLSFMWSLDSLVKSISAALRIIFKVGLFS